MKFITLAVAFLGLANATEDMGSLEEQMPNHSASLDLAQKAAAW